MFHTLPHKMPKPVSVTVTQPVYGPRDEIVGNHTQVTRFTTRQEAYQWIESMFYDEFGERDPEVNVQVLPRLDWVKSTDEWEDIPF
jgi:hypothetical protein